MVMPCPEKKLSTFRKNELKTVKMFKYLGSLFDAKGRAEKDVNDRVKIAWSKWRETTGVMCHRNIPTKLKDFRVLSMVRVLIRKLYVPNTRRERFLY